MRRLSRLAVLAALVVLATPARAVWTRFGGDITATSLTVTGNASFQGTTNVITSSCTAIVSRGDGSTLLAVGTSTVTLTVPAGAQVFVAYSGAVSSASDTQFAVGFLVDGARPGNQTSTKGVTRGYIHGGAGQTASFGPHAVTGLSAGVHRFTLTHTGTATVNLPGTDGSYTSDDRWCAFVVRGS